jgi:hypothetical protein
MCLKLAQQGTKHRIVSQLLVIVQILIPQRDPEHALADHRPDRMLDQIRPTLVDEAAGQPVNQSDRLIHTPQQQHSGVRTHRPTVEGGHYSAALHA